LRERQAQTHQEARQQVRISSAAFLDGNGKEKRILNRKIKIIANFKLIFIFIRSLHALP
jgi:hypothetical protein